MSKIRLTEAQLHKVIKESVKNILIQEGFMDKMRGAYNGFKQGNQQMQDTQNNLNNVSQSYQDSQNQLRNNRITADNSLSDYAVGVEGDIDNAISSIQSKDINGAYKYLQAAKQYIEAIYDGLKEIANRK